MGSVANFNVGGKIQPLRIRKSMAYRGSNSPKNHVATEPSAKRPQQASAQEGYLAHLGRTRPTLEDSQRQPPISRT
jgi:hypothetical protein